MTTTDPANPPDDLDVLFREFDNYNFSEIVRKVGHAEAQRRLDRILAQLVKERDNARAALDDAAEQIANHSWRDLQTGNYSLTSAKAREIIARLLLPDRNREPIPSQVPNVSLIAALSDCSESLRVLIASHKLNPDDNETYCAARAAIAKAQGVGVATTGTGSGLGSGDTPAA